MFALAPIANSQSTYAADAWALGFTGKGVQIGIADDQAQLSHPEFEGRVYLPLKSAPFPNPEYSDSSGHGTHVMEVAADRCKGFYWPQNYPLVISSSP